MKTFEQCISKNALALLHDIAPLIGKAGCILAGGTALALQMGHRISEDFDFLTSKAFKTDRLLSEIRSFARSHQVLMEEDGALTCMINEIKVSFLKYDYPFLKSETLPVGIRLASVLDIAAMKVIAVSQRGSRRDFVDLYFILQTRPMHEIAAGMVKKFGVERLNPIHIGKGLVYFKDAESDPEPRYLQGRAVPWTVIRRFFEKHVKQFVLDLSRAREAEE